MSRFARSVVAMSIVTQAQPGTRSQASRRPRLVGVELALTFATEFASLFSFLLLVSVLPMLAAASGAGSAAAGLVTGALLGGTVLAELVAAFAIRRLGYRVVLGAGALLLGAPALALPFLDSLDKERNFTLGYICTAEKAH